MEMEETQIGRLEHKIEKLKTLGERTPGVEFLRSEVFSGDRGLAVIEHAPFGVIGAITPVTHSLPTITGNAVSMIAAGNTRGGQSASRAANGWRPKASGGSTRRSIKDLGIDNLICVIAEPTLESADTIFKHRDVALICVTGGAAVARAALNSGKRAIVAGPGNPPVVVDETADLDRAARCDHSGRVLRQQPAVHRRERSVRRGAGLRCDDAGHGASRRRAAECGGSRQAHRRRRSCKAGEGDDKHDVPCKNYLGKDAAVLAQGAGRTVPRETELLFGETDEQNPFVSVEQMMPFLPFVRCRNVDEAIDKAKYWEHGFRHTSIIHSNNVRNMTRMGRIMDTTLYVKNGPCMASLGLGGEGYPSFSIAGPTGEGVTTPLTFTRERRCSMIDDLWILGKPKK